MRGRTVEVLGNGYVRLVDCAVWVGYAVDTALASATMLATTSAAAPAGSGQATRGRPRTSAQSAAALVQRGRLMHHRVLRFSADHTPASLRDNAYPRL